MFFIYSYNEASLGAKALARELKARRIKHEKSNFLGSKDRVVINWGSQTLPPEVSKSRVINQAEKIVRCSNKLYYFKDVTSNGDLGPRIPTFTENPNVAREWVIEGKTVVARTVLNGSSGDGIHFMSISNPNSFVSAPLYVEYVKKKDEYRVHFVAGQIIDFQRKALRPNLDPTVVDWRVRNLAGGFIFVRGNVELPDDVRVQAQKAINTCNLDFGAVDIIYNENSGKAYVLEINTAPGLVGETCKSYANAFNANYKD